MILFFFMDLAQASMRSSELICQRVFCSFLFFAEESIFSYNLLKTNLPDHCDNYRFYGVKKG